MFEEGRLIESPRRGYFYDKSDIIAEESKAFLEEIK